MPTFLKIQHKMVALGYHQRIETIFLSVAMEHTVMQKLIKKAGHVVLIIEEERNAIKVFQ